MEALFEAPEHDLETQSFEAPSSDLEDGFFAPQNEVEKPKPFFRVEDTISGIYDAISGLKTTAPSAWYRLKEGMSRPDTYSPSARAAFDAEREYTRGLEEETQKRRLEGTSSSVGESFREFGPSAGFSVGSIGSTILGQTLGKRLAGAGAGLLAGLAIPDPGPSELIGTIGGFLGGFGGGAAASYRMAGATFLDDAWDVLNKDSMERNGRPMNEDEMKKAYDALLPVAQNHAGWEAGPETIGNMAFLGLGKIGLGLGGKDLLKNLAKNAAARAGIRIGALGGMYGSELGTEWITQLGQGPNYPQLEAYKEGTPMEEAVSPYDRPGGTLQALKDITPATLAGTTLMGAGAKGVQLAAKPFMPKKASADIAEEVTPLPTDAETTEEIASIRQGIAPVAEENAAAGNTQTAEALAALTDRVAEQKVAASVEEQAAAQEENVEQAQEDAVVEEEAFPSAPPPAPLLPGEAGYVAPEESLVQETGRNVDPATGVTVVQYTLPGQGNATVRVRPDGTANVHDIQIGDQESQTANKGIGTRFYEQLGKSLAQQGVRLVSTRTSQHGSSISPQALRVWEKLEQRGLARRVGQEEARVLDRFGQTDEVRQVPYYEFVSEPQAQPTSTTPAASPFQSRLQAKDQELATPEGRQRRRLQDHDLVAELNVEIGRQSGVKGVRVKVAPENRISPEFNRFRSLFESIFNHRIVLVTPEKKGERGWHGARFGAGNNIFINVDSTVNPMAVLGHEFMHSLEQSHPELYAELVEAVQRLGIVTEQQIEEYGQKYLGQTYDREEWRSEIINNIIGDRFFDGELFTKLAQQDPSLFARLVEVIRQWIANVRNKLQGAHGYDMSQRLGLDESALARIDDLLSRIISDVAHQEQGGTNAIPQQSPASVPVRQSPESSQGVPSAHPEGRETPREGGQNVEAAQEESVTPEKGTKAKKKNAPPELRRSIFLGKHGKRDVEFESYPDVEAFSWNAQSKKVGSPKLSEEQRSAAAQNAKGHMANLRQAFPNISEQRLRSAAIAYGKKVVEEARKVQEDEKFTAPKFDPSAKFSAEESIPERPAARPAFNLWQEMGAGDAQLQSEALDDAWTSFYTAGKANGQTDAQIEQAWAQEMADPESPVVFQGVVNAKRARKGTDFTPIDVDRTDQDPDDASPRVKFSATITPEQDAAYMAAVERGDMETAQRMVDEAARKAGYTVEAWHGPRSTKSFTEFRGKWHFLTDNSEVAEKFSDETAYELNIDGQTFPISKDEADSMNPEPVEDADWASGWNWVDPENGYLERVIPDLEARGYIERGGSPKSVVLSKTRQPVMRTFLKMGRSKSRDYGGAVWDSGKNSIEQHLKGPIDSFVAKNIQEGGAGAQSDFYEFPIATTYAVKSPSQIKSADPVTRDAQGNVIPLSQRFNPQSNDIRFSADNYPLPKERPYIQRAIEQHGEEKVQQVWNELQSDVALLEGENKRASEATEAEKEGPTKATQDQRKYKDDGTPVEGYREPIPDSTMRLLVNRVLENSAWLYGGGYTREFGREVVKYLRGNYSLPGVPQNASVQSWMALNLIQDDVLLGQLGLDPQEIKRIMGTTGTQIGRGLRAFRDLYQPVEELEKKAQEVTDKVMKENGIENPEEFAKTTLDAIEDSQKETVDAMPPETASAIAEEAREDAQDMGWFEGAMGAFDPERKGLLQRLKELLQKISAKRKEIEARSAVEPPSEAAFSAEEKPLSELQAELDQLVGEANEILDQLFKKQKRTRTKKAKPEEVEQEVAQVVAEEEKSQKTQESSQSLSDWVEGKPVEGVESFKDALKRFINPNGFNREAFADWILRHFPSASPAMVQSIVNNAADVVDGRPVEEMPPLLPQTTEEEPTKKKRQRRKKIKDAAQEAQKRKERAVRSVVSKLKRPKVPDLQKTNKFVKALVHAANSDILNSDTVRDAFAVAFDLHGLTQDRLKELAELIRDIEAMPDGMPKQTLLNRAYDLINRLSPPAELMSFLHQNLMGGVLGGVSTIVSQFSGLGRALNAMQGAFQFIAMTDPKAFANPANFFKVWGKFLRETWTSAALAKTGVQGTLGGPMYGLGVSPSTMATVRPSEMMIGRLKPSELWKMRVGRQAWLRNMMATEPESRGSQMLKTLTLFPSWMASRSFNLIRAAEAWSGNVDKNMAFRMLAVQNLVEKGSTWNKAWNTVNDWLNPKTNAQMWSESEKQAKEEAERGEVSPKAIKFRAEEIVQDKLDAEHNLKIENRHRELSAWLNFKADPLTRPGSWFSKSVMEKAPTPVKMVFLFSRFFANVIETAIFNSPLGFIHMSKERAAKGPQNEREKQIAATFGSLEKYRQYRNGLASAATVTTFIGGMAMALAYALWQWMDEDDEDKPPAFWITGNNAYDTEGQLKLGWWRPNTLFLRVPGTDQQLALNYVQANPALAITLNAIGNVADRMMFPELLNYSVDSRTGERQFSPFKATVKPMMDALVAPASRSTYVTFQQAIERSFQGNPQSLLKLVSRPVGETAASTLLGGPIVRDVMKVTKPEVPRTSKTAKQAIVSGIPFSAQMGMDTGLPIIGAFGDPSSGYAYFPFLSKEQATSKTVERAADILTDIGVTKRGPQEFAVEADLVEIAAGGERYLLNLEQREEVLGEIGMRFAGLLAQNEDKIRGYSKDSFDKAKKEVQKLSEKARKSVLGRWRDKIRKD